MLEAHGHSNNCRAYEMKDTAILAYYYHLCKTTGIQDGDTILSIGAGNGKHEFLNHLS